ncbi:efflux RND transporter periplasmic adaptor subunit [Telluribacter humicola]|uniref:efflux RND transporter periplasmic adaptor subunit n=1 Tax=Telluribacter humicola TaxID=1720261 RepID=UPI001A970F1D|nr:efflux RND transporter periplasmic adaptor subunit [Telluribacter humicola]
MKRNYIGNVIVGILLFFAVASCKQEQGTAHEHGQKYTCPMHPQIIKNEPGDCPICGMDLVPMAASSEAMSGEGAVDTSLIPLLKPTNERVVANVPAISPEKETRILSLTAQGVVSYDLRKQVSVASRVAGRIENMYIRYNFQPVRKGQLLMEIYSPELAAAQREAIYISRVDKTTGLVEKARQKLQLLGMQPAQIDQVIRTGEPLYRVPVYSPVSGYIVDKTSLATSAPQRPMPATASSSSSGTGMDGMGAAQATAPAPAQPDINNSPILIREGQYVSTGETVFSIYQANSMVADFYLDPALSTQVKRGQKLVFRLVAQPDQAFTGTIGLIEPAQRAGENFVTARVYLSGSDLQPGQLLLAEVPVVEKQGWWLPQSAVVGLGNQSVVFKKEGGAFVPRQVRTGISAKGEVQILDDIAQWQVARNASYLVDNESFIRAPADF